LLFGEVGEGGEAGFDFDSMITAKDIDENGNLIKKNDDDGEDEDDDEDDYEDYEDDY
jgi:hypothetical protein